MALCLNSAHRHPAYHFGWYSLQSTSQKGSLWSLDHAHHAEPICFAAYLALRHAQRHRNTFLAGIL